MFKLQVVLAACLCVAYAGLYVGPLQPIPERFRDQKGCYVLDLDEVIPLGSSRPSKNYCVMYQCRKEHLEHVSCAKETPTPPCKILEVLNEPYPDCCPKIVCP